VLSWRSLLSKDGQRSSVKHAWFSRPWRQG
jgi:hypothetical protein